MQIPSVTTIRRLCSIKGGDKHDLLTAAEFMLLLFLCELVNILTEPYVFSRFLGAHPCKERLDAGWNTLIFKLNLTKE